MRLEFRLLTTLLICLMGAIVFDVQDTLQAAPPAPGMNNKHVLIIGIDGTRPDALIKAKTPHLDDLISHGSFSDTAQILGTRYQKNDTISGPGWSSILTGVWSDKHGVHDNTFKGKNYELFPHFFKHLKQQRPEAMTVSLVSWPEIHQHILSDADVAEVERMPKTPNQLIDLKISADKFAINTRDGNWHHLAATREAGTIKLFLDGQLIGQVQGNNDRFDLDGAFYFLGRDTRAGETCFHGQLDDIRLWERAHSEAVIGALAKPASDPAKAKASFNRDGLLAEYCFEQSAITPAVAREVINDTATHASGPFHAAPLSQSQARIGTAEVSSGNGRQPNQVFDLPSQGSQDHGASIGLKGSLKSITQGDFTIESRFRTTDSNRNILFGNYSGKAKGVLNLELHTDNTVRVYMQPAVAPGGDAQATDPLALENTRDGVVAEKASRILQTEDPTAIFVYFHQVDATGHRIGFSPNVPAYVSAIENVDQHVGTVLKGLNLRPNRKDEDWLVIVCTDHGGFQRGHGGGHQNPEIRNAFLIVSGPSAQVGKFDSPVYIVDVAATALTHLTGTVDPARQIDGCAVGLKKAP